MNYQGQMYGVFKHFGGRDNGYNNYNTNTSNVNVSVNIDMKEVLNTFLEYIEKKINHEPKEVEQELVEGIYFK